MEYFKHPTRARNGFLQKTFVFCDANTKKSVRSISIFYKSAGRYHALLLQRARKLDQGLALSQKAKYFSKILVLERVKHDAVLLDAKECIEMSGDNTLDFAFEQNGS